MTEEGQPQPAWRRALDWRTPGWCQESGVHGESWSLNGQACIAGLNPPFAGAARLASCLTWLVRSFASHCRRTYDATGAFAVTCTGRRMPSTLALTMSGAFDLALRDPKTIRARVRRRGGGPAACDWPAFWLEGAAYDDVIDRDPFPPVGTRHRKLVVLAEEQQVFVPTRAATLAAGIHRAWARGLNAVAGVEGAAVTILLGEDEHAFLLTMMVLVHARPTANAQPRPRLEESYQRHEGLIAELAPSARAAGLPVAWHALWRLPPAMMWSEPGGEAVDSVPQRSRSSRRCDRCNRQIDMIAREPLRVRVNDELVLVAGTCEEFGSPEGPQRLIRPPETTLFHQVGRTSMLSRTQIDRLGDRLRRGPLSPADVRLFDEYRRSFGEAY